MNPYEDDPSNQGNQIDPIYKGLKSVNEGLSSLTNREGVSFAHLPMRFMQVTYRGVEGSSDFRQIGVLLVLDEAHHADAYPELKAKKYKQYSWDDQFSFSLTLGELRLFSGDVYYDAPREMQIDTIDEEVSLTPFPLKEGQTDDIHCLVVRLHEKEDGKINYFMTFPVAFQPGFEAAFDPESGWRVNPADRTRHIQELQAQREALDWQQQYASLRVGLQESYPLTREQAELLYLWKNDPVIFFNLLWKKLFALRSDDLEFKTLNLELGLPGLPVKVTHDFEDQIPARSLIVSTRAKVHLKEISMAVVKGSITLNIAPITLSAMGKEEAWTKIVQATVSDSSPKELVIMVKLNPIRKGERFLELSAFLMKKEGENYVQDVEVSAGHFRQEEMLVRLITALGRGEREKSSLPPPEVVYQRPKKRYSPTAIDPETGRPLKNPYGRGRKPKSKKPHGGPRW